MLLIVRLPKGPGVHCYLPNRSLGPSLRCHTEHLGYLLQLVCSPPALEVKRVTRKPTPAPAPIPPPRKDRIMAPPPIPARPARPTPARPAQVRPAQVRPAKASPLTTTIVVPLMTRVGSNRPRPPARTPSPEGMDVGPPAFHHPQPVRAWNAGSPINSQRPGRTINWPTPAPEVSSSSFVEESDDVSIFQLVKVKS